MTEPESGPTSDADPTTDTDSPIEADEPTAAAAAPSIEHDPGRSAGTIGFVLAGIFFLVAVAMTIVASRASSDSSEDLSEIRIAASSAIALVADFNPSQLDENHARILEISTGAFKESYEDTYEDLLKPLIVAGNIRGSASIKEVFVLPQSDTEAVVIVVADTRSESTVDGQLQTNRQDNEYMRLNMVRVDGQWKLANLQRLGFLGLQAPPASPTIDVPVPGQGDGGTDPSTQPEG